MVRAAAKGSEHLKEGVSIPPRLNCSNCICIKWHNWKIAKGYIK
jgi:hypothetical protein